jgi:glutamate carboxypeptidase
MTRSDRLSHLRGEQAAMVDELASLIEAESPSGDASALSACADAIDAVFAEVLGGPFDRIAVDGVTHLRWVGPGPVRVAFIGHYDTVWPVGTLPRWPFTVDGDRATGPGAFDMKAGIVQLAHALGTLDNLTGVGVLLTADEETGSLTSRSLIEDLAAGAQAALVLEPSAGGAVKNARKGTGMYTLSVQGRASHAGLEPEKGINALVGLAEVVLAVGAIGRAEVGTTVTPTVATAGTATNVVPALATAEIDVRVWLPEEADRVDAAIRALRTTLRGATLVVSGGPNRPPMPERACADLTKLAVECADRLGIGPLTAVGVGGGSDGNFTAAVGTPTLDGLGAVGDGAHAEGEYVVLPAMAERAALVAEIAADLLA